MSVFFIADTHFGEKDIIKYTNRRFDNADDMDKEIIFRWNSVVKEDDIVYHLGDFGGDGKEKQILSKLNGKKYLVKGNHDTKSNQEYRDFGFIEVYDHPIIIDDFWILSHEPLYISDNNPYAILFGHVHLNPIFRDCSTHHFCVTAERINFTPIDFNEIKERMKKSKN